MLTTQYAIKQQNTLFNSLTSAIMLGIGAAATYATGGLTFPLLATIGAGAFGLMRNDRAFSQNRVNLNATIEQAKEKYGGNIISSNSADFAFINWNMTDQINNQPPRQYDEPLTFRYLTDEQKAVIDQILFKFGRYAKKTYEYLDMLSINDPYKFLYFEIDMDEDTIISMFDRFTQLITDNGLCTISREQISNYLLNFMNNGIRIWKQK